MCFCYKNFIEKKNKEFIQGTARYDIKQKIQHKLFHDALVYFCLWIKIIVFPPIDYTYLLCVCFFSCFDFIFMGKDAFLCLAMVKSSLSF